MKKLIPIFLLCIILLCGCDTRVQKTAYDYAKFDTVITFTALVNTDEDFTKYKEMLFSELSKYNDYFDIYNHCDGITNLYDLNNSQGKTLEVSDEIIELLAFCREVYELTGGMVNCASGNLLSLWHEAREKGVLPNDEKLTENAKKCDINNMIIEGNSVSLNGVKLDVGAVAKGFAAEKAAKMLENAGCTDFIISAGGNVVTRGHGKNGAWKIGIQNPSGDGLIDTVLSENGAVVTSGGYNRYAEIDGKIYHHIIDMQTLYPAEKMKSVTVIFGDSAYADALSTYFFQLEPEEAQKQAEKLGAKIIIVDNQNKIIK